MPASPAPPCSRLVADASAFDWDRWYAAVGGRTIAIAEVDEYPAAHPRRAGAALQRARCLRARGVRIAGGRGAAAQGQGAGVRRRHRRHLRHRAERRLPRPLGHRAVRDRRRPAHAVARVPGGAVARVGDRVPARLLHARRDRHPARRLHPVARLRLRGGAPDRRQRPAAHPDRPQGRLRRAGPPRIDHPSAAGPAVPHGQRGDVDRAGDRPSRSTPASRSSATPAARAASTARPRPFPTSAAPRPGKDHLGYDRYVVDTGRCFPYFAKHSYCSICLPVCVYNHKEWARDFEGHETRLFPPC